jgi:hypothetical protein
MTGQKDESGCSCNLADHAQRTRHGPAVCNCNAHSDGAVGADPWVWEEASNGDGRALTVLP